jgi:polar amino acid transport system substrate-binding protein
VLSVVLSACGPGNAPTTSATGTAKPIGNAGTLIPSVFKWGEDSTGGMPYIAPADANNPKDPSNPNKDYYGFEVDVNVAMAQLMGTTQEPTQITWSNWPQGLQSQQFDAFMNGLEITPENAFQDATNRSAGRQALFSIPYYVYTQSIVVLSSNTTINSFDDLAGKTVETGTGYKAEGIIDDYNASHTNKIKKVTTDNPTPFNDLLSGRVDAYFLDTPIAKWYGANDPSGKFKVVGGDMDPGYYGIAFSPSNPNAKVLIGEVNQAIERLWLNGTLQKIYQTGGANNGTVLEKYDLWNSSQACIGNFLPDNPTHLSNCPTFDFPLS